MLPDPTNIRHVLPFPHVECPLLQHGTCPLFEMYIQNLIYKFSVELLTPIGTSHSAVLMRVLIWSQIHQPSGDLRFMLTTTKHQSAKREH